MIIAVIYLLLLFINIIIFKKQYYSNVFAYFFQNVTFTIVLKLILICIAFIVNY